jgi:hypothetical protein
MLVKSILSSAFTSSIFIFTGSFLTFLVVFFIFFGKTISSSSWYDSKGSFFIVQKYADVDCSLLLFMSFSLFIASLSIFRLFKVVAILLEILL